MKASVQPNDARVKELVAKFIEIGIAQDRAVHIIDNARYNRLYKAMERVRAELKAMPGDQRRALLPLLSYSNAQVRLKAAITLLAIYTEPARRTLEHIRDVGPDLQRLDAGMMLSGLDDGSYVPS